MKMGKAADKEESRGIEDTLSDLEIDKDADPEEVAADATEETETVLADATPEQSDDEEGEEDEDEDADDSAGVIPLPPPRAVAPAAPEPETPPETVLVPPPRPPTPRKRTNAGGAAKLGKGLADKVPGAEKVKVYKREKDGKKWFISEYTKADIANHTDFESFLTEYVKDDHGPGEYILVGVDSMGREMELGVVRLRGVPEKSGDHGALSVVQQIMAQNQKREAEHLKRMEALMQPQPQQDPLSLLTGVMALKKEMEGEATVAGGAAAAQASSGMEAMMKMFASSGDKTMQLMMMMMQQQQAAAQQQQNMMMQMLAKPKDEDPVTKLLLAKLVEDKTDSGSGALPPPTPPPPKEDNTVALITALAGFMGAMGGGGGDGEDDFKEFLKTQIAQQSQDKLSTKDVLELVNGAKGDAKTGGDALRESADNLALVMNIANNMNRQQEGGPAAGLFDALAALFSNRDFAGSIAQTIRQKTGGAPMTPQQQIAAMTPEQRAALVQRQQLLQQQRAALANATGQPGGAPAAALPPGYVMTPAGPVPQGGPPVPPTGAPAGVPTAMAPQVPNEAVQRAAEQQIARSRKLPELPANTYEHVSNLANAQDEGALVGATVTMLIYFAEFEDWRPFSETVLGLAREGNKQGTLEYLTAFFDGLSEIHMIDPTLSKKILAAIDAHFEVLKTQLSDLGLARDELLTGDDLLGDEEGDGDPGRGDVGSGEGDGDPTESPEPIA
jgi:hypothetical protein